MFPFDSPPSPYRRISNSASSNNNRHISNYFHSIKKPVATVAIVFLSLILLIIAIKIYLSTKVNDKQDHIQSSIIHHISSATETIDHELSCPISINNASWNQHGVIIVNQLGRCGSRSNELCNPHDLFFDDIHQNLYVVDTLNNRIQKYSLNEQINDNKVETVAFQDLISPRSIFVNTENEDMYVLDCDSTNSTNVSQPNYRVQLWRKNSSIGHILINKARLCESYWYYSHIILDKEMNIYVEANNELRKWFSSKNYTYSKLIVGYSGTLAGHSTSFSTLGGVYIDDDLTMYIVDQDNKKIEKWFSNFISPIIIKLNSSKPFGVILDCNQFIYHGDLDENIMYQLNPITNQTRIVLDLRLQQQLGQIGPPPLRMKFDKFYNMFVIDSAHSAIVKYSFYD